jgi:hypothetical protein
VDAPKLLLLLYLFYSVAIFLMTHYFGRFRVPLVVLFLPYAALALVEIVGWLRAPSLQGWKRHRARVLVAGCLLVLTVVLAFG